MKRPRRKGTEAGTQVRPTSVDDCRVMDLPTRKAHGSPVTAVRGKEHIPFHVARVYYLYGVPAGEGRGGHGHKVLRQVMIAVAGSLDLVLDDGAKRKRVHLDRASRGLYVAPMIWRDLVNFSAGAVCLVLASEEYDEGDYIRDYDEFVKRKRPARVVSRRRKVVRRASRGN